MSGLGNGIIVRYHGPGVLAEVTNAASGTPIPADSDSLILAMEGGQPMAPKLMHEFPRAAMNVEVKRGQRGEQIPRPHLRRDDLDSGAVLDWLKRTWPL